LHATPWTLTSLHKSIPGKVILIRFANAMIFSGINDWREVVFSVKRCLILVNLLKEKLRSLLDKDKVEPKMEGRSTVASSDWIFQMKDTTYSNTMDILKKNNLEEDFQNISILMRG
jgi:hypothetical protein